METTNARKGCARRRPRYENCRQNSAVPPRSGFLVMLAAWNRKRTDTYWAVQHFSFAWSLLCSFHASHSHTPASPGSTSLNYLYNYIYLVDVPSVTLFELPGNA